MPIGLIQALQDGCVADAAVHQELHHTVRMGAQVHGPYHFVRAAFGFRVGTEQVRRVVSTLVGIKKCASSFLFTRFSLFMKSLLLPSVVLANVTITTTAANIVSLACTAIIGIAMLLLLPIKNDHR